MKASELQVGDVINVPGSYLHDDLSGLIMQIKAERVQLINKVSWDVVGTPYAASAIEYLVYVHHSGHSRTWFERDEELSVEPRLMKLLVAQDYVKADRFARELGMEKNQYVVLTPSSKGRGRHFSEKDIIWVDPAGSFSDEMRAIVNSLIW